MEAPTTSQAPLRRLRWLSVLSFCFYGILNAGTPLQSDLSLSVSVSPSAFQPGSQGTVTLTLHNAGPGPSGNTTGPPHLANLVLQKGFRLDTPGARPPYTITAQGTGCFISFDIVGPFPDFSFGFVWSFYYEVVPAGESRTCVFPIEFYPTPFETFETFWRTTPLYPDQDPNPDNDRAYYTFVAGVPYVPPTPVSTLTSSGIAALTLSFFAGAQWWFRRRDRRAIS